MVWGRHSRQKGGQRKSSRGRNKLGVLEKAKALSPGLGDGIWLLLSVCLFSFKESHFSDRVLKGHFNKPNGNQSADRMPCGSSFPVFHA